MQAAVDQIIVQKLDTAAFWTDKRIRRLQDVATVIGLGRGIGEVVSMAEPLLKLSKLSKASARKYVESFMKGEDSPIRRHPVLLCCLLGRCGRLVDQDKQPKQSDEILALLSELKRYLPQASTLQRAPSSPHDTNGRAASSQHRPTPSSDFMDFMTALLAVCRPNVEETTDWLFRGTAKQGADRRLAFDTMRYAKDAGYVARSITTIRPPSKNDLGMDMPFPYFSNFYESKPLGVKRVVHGIAIKFGPHLYLLGGLHQPSDAKIKPLLGLKLVALPITNPRQKNFYGLVLSMTPENNLVAGRIALMAMSPEERAQFRGGIFREEDLLEPAEAVAKPHYAGAGVTFKKVRHHIKNQIDFKLIGQLLYDGRPRKQHAIRDLVEQLCRTAEGDARFMLRPVGEDEKDFNPASHEDFPFNQALLAPKI